MALGEAPFQTLCHVLLANPTAHGQPQAAQDSQGFPRVGRESQPCPATDNGCLLCASAAVFQSEFPFSLPSMSHKHQFTSLTY